MQTLLNNAQLLFVVAFVALSLLGRLFQKIQEQREVQRRRAAAERARVETLRTGRVVMGPGPGSATPPMYPPANAPVGPPTSAAEALARLEEIARRRQEQVGRSRPPAQQRRAQESSGPVIVMGPQGPIVLRPGQSGPMPTGVPQGRKPKQSQRQQQQQRPKQPKQTVRPTPPAPPEPAPEYNVIEQARTAPPTPTGAAQVARRPAAALPGGAPQTPEEWRRLAAASVIFGRPVGDPTGDGGTPQRLF